jgi:hypothetical protein
VGGDSRNFSIFADSRPNGPDPLLTTPNKMSSVDRASGQPQDIASDLDLYQYPRPLQGRNIRLIQILPGAENDIIEVTIREAALGDIDVHYKAISYAWGNAQDLQPLLCEGKRHMVTRSLYRLLQRCRGDGDSTPLWADIICINQNDNREKTAQVRMMFDIYHRADTVIAWDQSLSMTMPE